MFTLTTANSLSRKGTRNESPGYNGRRRGIPGVYLRNYSTAAASCKSDDEKKDEDREQEEWILKTRKEKKWKINRKE